MDRHDRETEDVEPGTDAVKLTQARIGAFAQRWSDSYPAAVRCLLDDRESLTVHLRFPREHWTRVRHSNFIERSFGESRRRVKVIGRLPGEHSCLSLVWAVLDRASAGWRGFTMSPAGAAAAARSTPLTARSANVIAPTEFGKPLRNHCGFNRFRSHRIAVEHTGERELGQAALTL
jgi:hypothetical protein